MINDTTTRCHAPDCYWSKTGPYTFEQGMDALIRHEQKNHGGMRWDLGTKEWMRTKDSSDEVRVTNEKTGGQKGSKPQRFDLVPTGPLFALAEHFGRGAEKYAERNWELGVDWSLSYAALQRHILAWWGGEDFDEEGNPHLVSAMWHCTVLIEYSRTHPELDNRPKHNPEKGE